MSTDLVALLSAAQLPAAAAVLPAWLDRAASEELSYADFLAGLLEEELVVRSAAGTQRRLRDAGFPFAASIEQFDFRFRPDLKRQLILRYLDPTVITQAKLTHAGWATRTRQNDARHRHRHETGATRRHGTLHHGPDPGSTHRPDHHLSWSPAVPAPTPDL